MRTRRAEEGKKLLPPKTVDSVQYTVNSSGVCFADLFEIADC